MSVHQQQLTFTTAGHGAMRDLTAEVERIVKQAGIKNGLVNVFVIGSTAAVGTIEFEPGLQKDLPQQLDRLFPPSRDYAHEKTWQDGNGHSHLQATLQGPSLTVPLLGGKLTLGTWQQIFFLECDVRSRERNVVVTVMGE
jgi:secondary thiamine-phosphate synthase enzyme